MRKIEKLILKELLPTLGIACAVLTFMAFTREFNRFSLMLVNTEIGLDTMLIIVATITVNVLSVTLPIAFLIAIISCFSRLSADNEILALKSGGISTMRLFLPVLILAGLLTGLTLSLTAYCSPWANNHLRQLQQELAVSQITTDIRPRVFNQIAGDYVIYVEDVDPQYNRWYGIFLTRQQDGQKNQNFYLAREGQILIHPHTGVLQLHLEKGLVYGQDKSRSEADALTRFGALDIPLHLLTVQSGEPVQKKNMEKSMSELAREIDSGLFPPGSDPMQSIQIEYYRRLAIPFACLVFAMIGVPLGISTRRGGKSYGFIVSLGVVLLYYLTFIYSWKAGVFYHLFPIRIGVWVANILFALLGVVLLYVSQREKNWFSRFWNLKIWDKLNGNLKKILYFPLEIIKKFRIKTKNRTDVAKRGNANYFRLLDAFILTEFVKVLLLTVLGAVILFTIFTLFELIDEIFSHQIPWNKVVEYFVFAWPMVLVISLPICILVSMLITLGLLEKSNQILAMKSCGISLYRVSAPIIAMGLVVAMSIFLLQELVLPVTNQRQERLRDVIKGRKVATLFQPEESWVMGNFGKMYHYSYFDSSRSRFADLSVFGVDLKRAQLRFRYWAREARWDYRTGKWILTGGWERSFDADTPRFEPFSSRTFSNLTEKPDYFKKESQKSDKLSFGELSRYIDKLKQSGFETVRLEVDLYAKISYPAINLIMLLIGLPFSFKMGKRGALYGVATSIMLGITFWALFNLFTTIGSFGLLPPLLAAWAPNLFFGAIGLYLILTLRT